MPEIASQVLGPVLPPSLPGTGPQQSQQGAHTRRDPCLILLGPSPNPKSQGFGGDAEKSAAGSEKGRRRGGCHVPRLREPQR